MRFLTAFIALPIVEIILFVEIGGLIGVWWTLAVIFGSAALGIWLLRNEGTAAVARIQRSFNGNTDPAAPVSDTAMILLAGILLILPGFLTDTIGVICLIPAVRKIVYNLISKRVVVHGFGTTSGGRTYSNPDIIEGEFVEVDENRSSGSRPPSGWTRLDD